MTNAVARGVFGRPFSGLAMGSVEAVGSYGGEILMLATSGSFEGISGPTVTEEIVPVAGSPPLDEGAVPLAMF